MQKHRKMEDDQLIILIKKYLDGKASAEEIQVVEQWYEQQAAGNELFYKNDAARIAESSERSLNKIRAAVNIEPEVEKSGKVVKFTKNWMAIAASVLIFLTAGLFFVKWRSNEATETYQVVKALNGHITHVVLDDKTSIWLNAGSELKYPRFEKDKKREVYLDGEAYFDVTHDVTRPFIVHSSKLTTTVLGTAFSVTSYPNMVIQSVTVIRGKVQVATATKVLGFLTPNKRVEFNTANNTSSLTDVSAENIMSWKDGKLQFENQDMADITGRLSRWYGYTFKFNNADFERSRYTASFNNRIKLDDLLKVMKAISRVDYRVNDAARTVTFLKMNSNK